MPAPTTPRLQAGKPTPQPLRPRAPAAAPASAPASAPAPPAARRRRGEACAFPRNYVKKYLIAGLLVWLPLAITIWVLQAGAGPARRRVRLAMLSASQAVLPGRARVARNAAQIPGLGVVVMVLGLLLTGVFAANIFGQWALRQATAAHAHPDRQVDLQLGQAGLRHAVLEQRQRLPRSGAGAVPRAGPWTIAFVTGKPGGEAAVHLRGDYVSVYVPTTPNPTSGFFLMVPRADVIVLKMSVDEALKYVISMGVVAPPLPRMPPSAEIDRAEAARQPCQPGVDSPPSAPIATSPHNLPDSGEVP
jgi:uncharacterized membrane protein